MKKEKIICTYCGRESHYIYHRNKKGKVDWNVCLKCLKRFCDKVLGEGKNGGRAE